MQGGKVFHLVTRGQGSAGAVPEKARKRWGNNGSRGVGVGAREALFAETVMGRGDREMVAVALTTVTIGLRTEGHRGANSLLGAGDASNGIVADSDLFEVGMIVRRQTPGQTVGGSVSTQEVADEEEWGEITQK